MQRILIFNRPQMGAEHHIEIAGLGPFAYSAALRARYNTHTLRRMAMFSLIMLFKMVCTEALVAVQAFNQRVIKDIDMPGSDPYFAGKDD